MKQNKHPRTRLLIISCLISLCLSLPASAKENKIIDKIPLSFSSSVTAGKTGGEIYVSVDDPYYTALCRIVNIQITNQPDSPWAAGVSPKIMVSLRAERGCYFSSDKKAVSLIGAGAELEQTDFLDSQTVMHVTVRLSPLSDPAAAVSLKALTWDKSTVTALWDDDSNARYYQVQLCRNGAPVGAIITTYTNFCHLSGRISGEGSYSFNLRSVDNSLNRSSWVSSDSWYISFSEAASLKNNIKSTYGPSAVNSPSYAAGEWKSTKKGRWFEHPDGTWTANGWEYINGEWYYFDHDGYRKSGWIPWQGTWYYCNGDGIMLRNTATPDGYEVGSDGAVIN